MRYSLLIEPVHEAGFPPGYYYAHVPALDLTTHGEGIEGAKAAAEDLIRLWAEEKRARGEPVPREADASGVNAFLVGEAFMRAPDPGRELARVFA